MPVAGRWDAPGDNACSPHQSQAFTRRSGAKRDHIIRAAGIPIASPAGRPIAMAAVELDDVNAARQAVHTARPSWSRTGDRQGVTLLVDGVEQSHVNLADPRQLEFPYVRVLAALTRALPQAASVLHLGAGAMTLPRHIAAVRPGTHQIVVERDQLLAEFVLRTLPLPAGADITVSIADARAAVEACGDAEFDLVIGDVYQAAQMPNAVASVQFARHVGRVLRDRGVYATNVVDLPPLTLCRIQAATLRAAFGDVCLITEPAMLRGRRYGNVVLAASRAREGLPLERLARLEGRAHRVLHGADLDDFVMGTGPMVDG
jgi:spermidine synthase